MKIRLAKKIFYKESAKCLLKRGRTEGYISPNTIKYVVRKLEKLTKLKLLYYGGKLWTKLLRKNL